MSSKQFGTYLISNDETKKQISSLNEINFIKNIVKFDLPDSFNGSQVWKNYLPEVPNQYSVKSCWAYSSLFCFSSRLAIYTKGKYKFDFSPAKMIFGKNNDFTKLKDWNDIKQQLSNQIAFDFSTTNKLTKNVIEPSVQSLIETAQYLYRFGVCENKCIDKSLAKYIYSSIQLFSTTYDECPNENNDEMINHRIDGYYYVPGTISKNSLFGDGDESDIRTEIYHWGPVCSVMRVFLDFFNWDGKGIYKYDETSEQMEIYGHSVIICGWGEEDGIKYWLCCNTWGANWGDNGYFKIIRGVNNCEIEENVVGMYPALPGIRLFLEVPILYDFDDFIMRSLWGVKDNGYKITSYEKVMLKKKDVKLYESEYIYEPQYWPDFSKLIAGNLDTIKFNIQITSKENYNNRKCIIKKDNVFETIVYFLLILIIFKIAYRLFPKISSLMKNVEVK